MEYRPFYFYRGYLELTQKLPEEYRNEFLTAIVTYGTEGTYTITDAALEAAFLQIKASIDASARRHEECREYGKRGGRPREINRDVVARYHNSGLSISELSEVFRCSKRTIQRILKANNSLFGDSLFESRKKKNYRAINEKLANKLLYGDEDYSPFGLCLTKEQIDRIFNGKY